MKKNDNLDDDEKSIVDTNTTADNKQYSLLKIGREFGGSIIKQPATTKITIRIGQAIEANAKATKTHMMTNIKKVILLLYSLSNSMFRRISQHRIVSTTMMKSMKETWSM